MKTQNATYPALCHFAPQVSGAGEARALVTAASALPLYAPFLLLIRWVLGWAVSEGLESQDLVKPVMRRRHQWFHDLYDCHLPRRLRRRCAARAKVVKSYHDDYIAFFTLLDDTHNKRDFNEKLTRLSIYGRIFLFGMRGFKLRPLCKATLKPNAFTAKATPATAAINSGLWDAQALPG